MALFRFNSVDKCMACGTVLVQNLSGLYCPKCKVDPTALAGWQQQGLAATANHYYPSSPAVQRPALSQQSIASPFSQLLAGLSNTQGQIQEIAPVDVAGFKRLRDVEPHKVTRPVPDYIAPLVAWRAWKTVCIGGEWRLQALGKLNPWEPKKALEARCEAGRSHPSPNKECSCGIWSFTSLDTLLSKVDNYEVKVLGQVSIWGRIVECEHGFRSQFAYPKELWLVDGSMEQLGYIYGVPVRTAP
jgi:hypothetical protein